MACSPKLLIRKKQKAKDELCKLVCMRFQILFHSPNRGSFHLSLTVLCAIGVFVYLALAGGPAIFAQDFTWPVLLRINPKRYFCFGYKALTFYGAPFQESSPTKVLCNSLLIKQHGLSIPLPPLRHPKPNSWLKTASLVWKNLKKTLGLG